jgi:hypothetical protein
MMNRLISVTRQITTKLSFLTPFSSGVENRLSEQAYRQLPEVLKGHD